MPRQPDLCLIKVFIGSPDDLQEERNLFKDVVESANKLHAHSMGFHLEPVMWEDTLPGRANRCQELINDEDLKECDVFVLLLWKRWGTPTGKYSSGFEEEYEVANSLCNSSDKRRIILYFRAIPGNVLEAPDDQLKKVLAFRKKVQFENRVLYKFYDNPLQWKDLLLSHLCDWVDKQVGRRDDSTMDRVVAATTVSYGDRMIKKDVGTPKWSIVDTPDSIPSATKELLNPNNQGSEINKIAISSDGSTLWAIVRCGDRNGIGKGGAQVMLYRSNDSGWSWDDGPYTNLFTAQAKIEKGTFIWDIAIAPDDPNIVAIACADITKSPLAQEVWISIDKGDTWKDIYWPPDGVQQGVNLISAMDISRGFGVRTILVGTRDGGGKSTNNLQMMPMTDNGRWSIQNIVYAAQFANPITGDILAAKFSPSFASDGTIVVLYTCDVQDHLGTWLATGIYNYTKNIAAWQPISKHIEIRNPDAKKGDSPQVKEIIAADLALPSDFSGQNKDHRHFYVSTDAIDRVPNEAPNCGVYRIDDEAIHVLMNTTATFAQPSANKMSRRVSSIGYYGACASGKLLVGEVLGNGSRATVPTWFTDSPTVCPIPCWYPALKPPTGAAGQDVIRDSGYIAGYGNAKVVWSPDGTVAYAATGSASLGPYNTPAVIDGAVVVADTWPAGYVNVVPFDESAISVSRTNGEIWNQISLIDTLIAKLTDVVPSADGRTIFLASVNTNAAYRGFDSVWRSSIDPRPSAPFPPALPLGTRWERVLCCVTASEPSLPQSDALLRLPPPGAPADNGMIVGWAAQGTRAQAWSPDWGDYWATITPRHPIQDFAFESPTMLYNLDPFGIVQRMPYTGTAWSYLKPDVDSLIRCAHMIAAQPDGNIIVGAASAGATTGLIASVSIDGGKSFSLITNQHPILGNIHVTFDPSFDTTKLYYVGDDSINGTIFRAIYPEIVLALASNDVHNVGIFGLQIAPVGGKLYAAHNIASGVANSGVCRIEKPLSDRNKTDIRWNCLNEFDVSSVSRVRFTSEPLSLKLSGGVIKDMDILLFAIDNDFYAGKHNAQTRFRGIEAIRDRGMLWMLVDRQSQRTP